MSIKVKIYNQNGEAVGEEKLSESIFGIKVVPELVYQVINYYLANRRRPIAHTKDRSEVRGGGRKPWRQKGTGRARHGSIRSPLWIGGGITFGPRKERNFLQKINKKMKRKALFSVLSYKRKAGKLILMDKVESQTGKTKETADLVDKIQKKIIKEDKKKSLLFVLGDDYINFKKSVNNLPKVEAIGAKNLNTFDVLKYEYLVATPQSLKIVEKIFKLK